MITLKELEDVNKYPRMASFPGVEYARETFAKMREQLNLYEKYFKGKEYSIIFSDSEEIDFEIQEKNVCHMLGLEYQNFFDGGYYLYEDFRSDVLGVSGRPTSYEWAKLLLDASDEVIAHDRKSKDSRAINYFKCKIKCAIFEKLFDLEQFNFGKLNDVDGTKLLYTQSNEPISPYFLIRLKEEKSLNASEDQRRSFIINSLLAPQACDLKEHFSLPASIPTQIMVDDNNDVTVEEATSQQKINLLNQYKSIISSCQCPDRLNVYGDYIATLSRTIKNR